MPEQNVSVELFYDGVWNNVAATDDVYTTPPIKIQRGQGEEGAAFKPSRINFTLANDDDKYRPSNPESPLYGKVGRNTPTRVKVGTSIRATGEASFEPDQTDDFRVSPARGKAWVDVDAAGLLQRIGQWTEPLRSPFYTYNTTEIADVCGYWPMEDPRGSLKASTPIAGAENTHFGGQAFDSQKRPPGSGPVVDVELLDTAVFRFNSTNSASTAGWQYSHAINMNNMGGSSFTILQVEMLNGYDIGLLFSDATDELYLIVADENTDTIAQTIISTDGYQWTNRWMLMVLDVRYSAGTTTVEFIYQGIGDTGWLGFSTSYVGLPSQPMRAFGSGFPEGTSYGHVIATNSRTDSLWSDDRWDAFLGHAGELAAVRFGRLCDQRGVGYYVSTNWAMSTPMGPQQVDSFPNLLREIVQTEDALLFDLIDETKLFLLCRADRYNQTPALVLQATDLKVPPKEVLNDLDPHNIVTAKQRDGGDYTAEDSSSPMGSQPPPDGVGEYKQTVDINIDTDAASEMAKLAQHAHWWLNKGTINRPRFPQIVVELTNASAGVIEDVEAVDVGSVIHIEGFREYTIELFVLGLVETIGTHTRQITFTTGLNLMYVPGEYDGVARYDSSSTTLDEAIDASETAWSITTANEGDVWRSGSDPGGLYDWIVNGERVTVTNMTAASGSGPYLQDATVIRSVNGISRTHASGDEVHVATPGRWAL